MLSNTGTLLSHLKYNAWASRKLVEACRHLPLDDRIHDFKTADRSILGTLVHIFAADRIWLGRVEGNPPAVPFDPERDLHFSVLDHEWPPLHERWIAWAAGADPAAVVSYKDLKGNPYQTPVWQIILHLVNHGTHHRGQVSGFMRTLGHTPPPLDLIAYYRGLL